METKGTYNVDGHKKKKFFPSRFVKRLPAFELYSSKDATEPCKAFKIFSMEEKSIFLCENENGFDLVLANLIDEKFVEIPGAFIFLHGFDIKLVIDRLNSVFFQWKIESKKLTNSNNNNSIT